MDNKIIELVFIFVGVLWLALGHLGTAENASHFEEITVAPERQIVSFENP